MCFYSFLCVLLSGRAEAAGKLGPGHRVGGICAVLPAGGRRLGRVQPGRQQGGRSAAAVQQWWRHQLGPHRWDVLHWLHKATVRKRRRQENECLTRFCCFLLSVSESRFRCGCSDCVFVKGNVINQSPFLFSALSTMSFLWPRRRPPRGSAGGSLFTLGRATTSGQSMMSSFCRRGRNTSSPWPIQPCHRSGIGFYRLYIMCSTL